MYKFKKVMEYFLSYMSKGKGGGNTKCWQPMIFLLSYILYLRSLRYIDTPDARTFYHTACCYVQPVF